MITQPM